jgi:hypothetical protein
VISPHMSDQVEEAFVEPAYGTRSLVDVVPAVGAAIGVRHRAGQTAPSGLVLPEAPAYVLFLVDGLGSRLLQRHADAAPYLSTLLATQEPPPPASARSARPCRPARTGWSASPRASRAPTGCSTH